jgi:hypothetical protein
MSKIDTTKDIKKAVYEILKNKKTKNEHKTIKCSCDC